MSEFVKTLIAAGIGGLISGVFLLMADYLRHHRKGRELLREILVKKRVEACQELMRLVFQLAAVLDPLQRGVKHFQPQTSQNVGQQLLRETTLEEIRTAWNALNDHVRAAVMFLGPKIMAEYQRYHTALDFIKTDAAFGETHSVVLSQVMGDVLGRFADAIGTAIKGELGGDEIDFLSRDKARNARKSGHKLFQEAKAQIEDKMGQQQNSS